MQEQSSWRVHGSYFEACNCYAICPCRRHGDRPIRRSTHGACDFALSWRIDHGWAGNEDLSGRQVVMAGSFVDDPAVDPSATLGEWQVTLYLDAAATRSQAGALEAIFLGRAGGTTLTNFARQIGTVHAVRRADIRLDHRSGRQRMDVGEYVSVRTRRSVNTDEPVSCGIPGHDHPGTEVVTEVLHVDDAPLDWEVTGSCGFATDFDYRRDS